MKQCRVCKDNKNLEEFGNLKTSADGKTNRCKKCKSTLDRKNYDKNREVIIKKNSIYYEANKEEILAKRDKEHFKQYNKKYRQDNKEYISEYNKAYKLLNNTAVKTQQKDYNENNREKINKIRRDWINDNPHNKLLVSIRKRMYEILTTKEFTKETSFSKSIGCSLDELRSHIEKQFQPGMTWENYGIWHLDHNLALANAQTVEQLYKLNHYTNLRPMWAKSNIAKGKRSDICWQKLQRDSLVNEDRELGMPFDKTISDFSLSREKITKEHRNFIERYEWLGTVGYGVRHVFTARVDGILGGVVMIAEPNKYQFEIKLEALIQRGACASWTPKNLGSKLVMFACRWMIRNTEKRIFTAYSDPTAGEIGTIYQACNFDYLGGNFGNDYLYILEDGRKVGNRDFTRTSAMKKWAKELNIEWLKEWLKPNGYQDITKIPKEIRKQLNDYAKKEMNKYKKIKAIRKGKYVLLLNYGKEKIEKTWKSFPYPKRIIE